eukprot:4784495-Pleurochrysis_carterae.AAC.1
MVTLARPHARTHAHILMRGSRPPGWSLALIRSKTATLPSPFFNGELNALNSLQDFDSHAEWYREPRT